MIVVLGPDSLVTAVTAAHAGELIVGATDDERLAGPIEDAADIASVLPIPARACVLPAGPEVLGGVEVVRRAGGSLIQSRIVVVGTPPYGELPSAWKALVARLGASAVADSSELAQLLSEEADSAVRSPEEQRAMRPGAPEAAAWRDALRRARPRRRLLRRRSKPLDRRRSEKELDAVIRRPITEGCHSVAVISPKGGVGKTTLSFLLGSVLARVRGDRVLVVDTNPDFGTLADLVGERVPATISDLLRDLRFVRTDDDMSAYVTTTRSGMHILAAPQDPVEMTRVGSGGYRAISEVICRFYDIVVFDCGTGFTDDISQFVLRHAGHVVLVTASQLVSAKIVLQALDRLTTTDFEPNRATLAINMVRAGDSLDLRRVRDTLGARVGSVVDIPWDSRMQRDIDLGEFSYARMQAPTRNAIRRMSAAVVSQLPSPWPVGSAELVGSGAGTSVGNAAAASDGSSAVHAVPAVAEVPGVVDVLAGVDVPGRASVASGTGATDTSSTNPNAQSAPTAVWSSPRG
jgi:MinD-like ATPase involved in chromosome partitioning or flagellar assembly